MLKGLGAVLQELNAAGDDPFYNDTVDYFFAIYSPQEIVPVSMQGNSELTFLLCVCI